MVAGASLAGYSVVRALREYGYRGGVTVVGEEIHPPYDRPPLSKEFLHTETDLALARADEADPDTTWLLGRRATGITGGPGLTLDDGTTVSGQTLILATGARARSLPSAGNLRGVHTLRTLDDAHALRGALRGAQQVVIVGAGLIGSEIASTAATLGIDVTIVEIADEPLATVFGTRIAALCAGLHAGHGVRLRTGVAVQQFLGTDRVSAVRLTDGTELPADLVVVGIGAVPNTEWARDSDLRIDNGFLTDARCRTTVPGIYAIGDCARTLDETSGAHRRSEHWTNATVQARIAAAAIVGAPPPQTPAPYFWSRQYGRMIQFVGERRPTDEVHFLDGEPASLLDPDTPSCVALYQRDGEPVAVFAVDNPRLFTRYRKQLERRLLSPTT